MRKSTTLYDPISLRCRVCERHLKNNEYMITKTFGIICDRCGLKNKWNLHRIMQIHNQIDQNCKCEKPTNSDTEFYAPFSRISEGKLPQMDLLGFEIDTGITLSFNQPLTPQVKQKVNYDEYPSIILLKYAINSFTRETLQTRN